MNLTVGQTGSGAVMGGMLAALALTAGGGAAGYYFAPKGWGYKTVGVVAGALVGNLVGGMVAGASVLGALMGQRENEDKEQGQEPGDAGGLNFVTDQFLNYGTPMQFNPDQRYLYMGNMRGKKYRKNYPVQAAYSDSAYIGKQGDLMDGYKPGAYRNAMARPKKRRYDGNSFQFVDRAKRAFMGM